MTVLYCNFETSDAFYVQARQHIFAEISESFTQTTILSPMLFQFVLTFDSEETLMKEVNDGQRSQ